MTKTETPRARVRTALVVLGLTLTTATAWAAWRMPPKGHDHAALARFFGRFHPLLVHAPIALLLLVPVLELVGRRRGPGALRGAAGFVLALAAGAAVVAAADGWLLAWSDGYGGALVVRHMWGGIALAGVCVVAAWVRCRPVPPQAAYCLLLAAAVGLMVWATHQGGSLTHGGGYLTDEMPGRLRKLIGLPRTVRSKPVDHAGKSAQPAAARVLLPPPIPFAPGPPVRYAAIVPAFERSCLPCHRAAKHKGDLRMDSYERLMEGGEDGEVVVPGDPAGSELIQRVTLPPDDDDYMPSDGKKPLSRDEIIQIERWIAGGAKQD